jgi:hypothetical protein
MRSSIEAEEHWAKYFENPSPSPARPQVMRRPGKPIEGNKGKNNCAQMLKC